MLKLFSNGKIYFALAASVLVLLLNAAFYYFVISAQESDIAALERKGAELKAVLRGRQGSLPAAKAGIAKFKSALPDSASLTVTLAGIFDAARRNGIRVPEGNYSPESVKDSGFSSYTFSLPIEGRYPDIKRFLNEIESGDQPIVIEEVALTGGKAGQSAMSLKIKMSAYYR